MPRFIPIGGGRLWYIVGSRVPGGKLYMYAGGNIGIDGNGVEGGIGGTPCGTDGPDMKDADGNGIC